MVREGKMRPIWAVSKKNRLPRAEIEGIAGKSGQEQSWIGVARQRSLWPQWVYINIWNTVHVFILELTYAQPCLSQSPRIA